MMLGKSINVCLLQRRALQLHASRFLGSIYAHQYSTEIGENACDSDTFGNLASTKKLAIQTTNSKEYVTTDVKMDRLEPASHVPSSRKTKQIQQAKKPKKNISKIGKQTIGDTRNESIIYDTRNPDRAADSFGLLDPEKTNKLVTLTNNSNTLDEEGGHLRLSFRGRQYTPNWYAVKIDRLVKQKKLQEALDTLEVDMLKTDRVMPTPYAFSALIGGVARAGDTKKAFSLFKKMKSMGLVPDQPTYTALFNACANCRNKEDGLRRMEGLRESMEEKGVEPNIIVYKAMMKAYVFCGDVRQAFSVADEIAEKELPLDDEVYKHLLMACISIKDSGFRHAIEVWHRMRKCKISPDTTHYNLLLRAIRQCGPGQLQAIEAPNENQTSEIDEETCKKENAEIAKKFADPTNSKSLQYNPEQVFLRALKGNTSLGGGKPILDITPKIQGESDSVVDKQAESLPKETFEDSDLPWWQNDTSMKPCVISNQGFSMTPVNALAVDEAVSAAVQRNVLNPRVNLSLVSALPSCVTPQQRLALLGGADGFLSHMEKDGAKPDMKTITQLMYVMPKTLASEEAVLVMLKKHELRPDVNLLNGLMRQRIVRSKSITATEVKDVLALMGSYEVSPDLKTFEIMSRGCYHHWSGLQLLKDMEDIRILPDKHILSHLIDRSGDDLMYKRSLVLAMKKNSISPDKQILHRLESYREEARKRLVEMEMRGEVDQKFNKELKNFQFVYSSWLKQTELDSDY